jgi:DMSO/TMAO reductase YedYZ molybdopterin-dependent catalytic subunit
MMDDTNLPPGQYEIDEFPRFGLSQFARRFPKELHQVRLTIAGDVGESVAVSDELRELPRVDETADFHCVTTWSSRALRWSGIRFSDFFERIVAVRARPAPDATFVILRCQDGYAVSLRLEDLLAPSVLLADGLNGEPLTIEHGAPLRLVAPAHYGYKSPKHLRGIEFWRDENRYRPAAFRFMDHPRARVAFEERGRRVPGWLLRYLYRPLVRPTITRFRRALDAHTTAQDRLE